MNFLEDLWYGNIEPAEYESASDKECREALQRIVRNEDKLLSTMTDEQKSLFSRYTEAIREYQATAERLLFQSSFKLGARMMLEVMEE